MKHYIVRHELKQYGKRTAYHVQAMNREQALQILYERWGHQPLGLTVEEKEIDGEPRFLFEKEESI